MGQFLRSLLSLSLICFLLAAQTPPPAAPPPTVPGGFNLPNASLLDVIDIIARDLHINYILDSRVKGGTVTINTYGTVRAEDLRPILETILRMNGLVMVQVGNLYRISPAAEVSHIAISPQVNIKDFPDDERVLLNLVFLKYMTAPEMEAILKPFLGESATMISYLPANLLMIEDNSRNMRRTMELINLFDADSFAGQRVQTFVTQNARPSDLVKELDTVFKAYALNEKNSTVKFLPIDRINTVLAVAANAGIFVQVKEWIAKLDVPVRLPVGAVSNYVYKLKYGRAEIIGSVLSQLYGTGGGLALNNSYLTAGSRFGGGNGSLSASNLGASFGSGFGSPYGANTFGTNTFAGTGSGLTPEIPNALSGAFAGPVAAAAPAAGAAGTTAAPTATATRDQTGQYLAPGTTNPTTGLPRIIPNQYDNTLIVQGTPQMWEQIQRLLDQIDISPRQVLIDARVYEVQLSGAFAYGINASIQQKAANEAPNARQLTGSFGALGGAFNAGTLLGRSRELLAAVSFAENNSKARVISAPSVVATDSIAASINVGTDVPTLSAQAVTPGLTNGGTSQFTQSVSNVSTGVSLSILARVNASGVVTMVIDQSVSSPLPTTSSGINSPSFSHRNVSTQVTVEDGDTVAIGGIVQESTTVGKAGIPLLDRIPWIGGAFGSTSYTKSKTELIIFLTPRVIYDTNQISDATEELRQKVKGLTRLIKDKY